MQCQTVMRKWQLKSNILIYYYSKNNNGKSQYRNTNGKIDSHEKMTVEK